MGDEHRLLSGKVAMITGASSGIGAAAARLFAEEGAAVVLMARRAQRLAELVEGIRGGGGRAVAVAGDVRVEGDVARAVGAALDAFGTLDAAFNNAGYGTAGVPLHEMDAQTYERTMDVNVRGVWNCLSHQIPAMLGSGRGGAVVNTSSVAGLKATGASAAYVASKHAVIGLTRAAAYDYGRRGIRVNALVVGATRSEMMDGVIAQLPELEEVFLADSLQHRMSRPEEVAQAAAWLCSERSSFVTGSALAVDGGSTAV
ncbi:glucose 1-dehydrogenase [Streptomyces rishiriensis]|nr:glucose 1-dehydrogenase [Streptomyces rishiriensis]